MPHALRTVAIATLTTLAAIGAIIIVDLTPPASAQSNEQSSGYIIARRTNDDRIEFGWQTPSGAQVFPSVRYFPQDAEIDRWLTSSPVIVGGTAIGRINARMRPVGRIEFGFTPTSGERILPQSRYFPHNPTRGRWLRSTEITIGENATSGYQPPPALSTTQDYTTVSAGAFYTCAIRAYGAIECWGDNRDGQTDAPDGEFRTVAAGGLHTCAIRASDSAIVCWGRNLDWSDRYTGQSDAPDGSYSAVSTGAWHSCGLRTNGAIICWGNNDYGQTDIPTGEFIAVSAGNLHSCGLRATGKIECWGASRKQPRYPDYDYGQSDAPTGSFRAVSAGQGHTCGLRTSGAIECWGNNEQGQANDPTGSFRAVSAGQGHTCGLRTSGAIECWGNNEQGQANDPTGTFAAVSAGGEDGGHTCGLRTNGAIECWGNNEQGQANDPTGTFAAVSAGGKHTCGLRADGEVECWGSNSDGQTTSPDAPLDQRIAERFAPVIHFEEGEQYFPVPVELMIRLSTLRYTLNGQPRALAPGTYSLADLISYNGQESYLDLADVARSSTGERVVYARVAETYGVEKGMLVQYWFFYLYNATGEPTHSHEGDWEGVQLWFAGLDRDDLLTATIPTQLGYAAHESGWAYTARCGELRREQRSTTAARVCRTESTRLVLEAGQRRQTRQELRWLGSGPIPRQWRGLGVAGARRGRCRGRAGL